jgi:hypothetical protein
MHVSQVLLALSTAFLLAACGGASSPPVNEPPPSMPPPLAPPQRVSVDCLASGPCTARVPMGDAPSKLPSGLPSNFSGYGDPSVRADPGGTRLWMLYSWLQVHVVSSTQRPPGVDIHLARSDDGGASWQFDTVLWPSTPGVDLGGSQAPGYEDHEVANLVPMGGAVPRWVGARLDYFVPNDGGFGARPLGSFRIRVGVADTVHGLAQASFASLGGSATAPGWGVTQNLSALSPALAACRFYNEPALHWRAPSLYLALRCHAFDALGRPDVAASAIQVFATTPDAAHATAWVWRYVGRLAAGAEGAELGGVGVTQVELATGRDGKLLALLTPDAWSSALGDFVHYGCRAVEVESLEPPRLARGADAKLAVRAQVTASDLAAYGPGACAYDAADAGGIVLVRRDMGPSHFLGSMHRTELRP